MDAIMNLPPHILFEIWSRLPIESILCCRCVCKLWSVLGYDSTFIDLHYSKSIKQTPRVVLSPRISVADPLPPWLFMVNVEEGNRKIPLVGLGFAADDEKLLLGLSLYTKIVGFCNGFLCISKGRHESRIYLCDLIFRRESMVLPKSQLGLPTPTKCSHFFNFGFGFDRFQNKYKVVRVWKRYGEIITVGESVWRKLDFPGKVAHSRPLHLDGILYWFFIHEPHEDFDSILVLDLKSEKFWNIKSPPPRSKGYRRDLIGSSDGSLSIIDCYCKNAKCMDVWLLEGNKTMGFSFRLTTYDISGLQCLQQDTGWECLFFKVLAKLGHDAFLLCYFGSGSKCSLLLYSPMKPQQYLSVLGTLEDYEDYEDYAFEPFCMVPTLKSIFSRPNRETGN